MRRATWSIALLLSCLPAARAQAQCQGDAAKHNPCCWWKTDPSTCRSVQNGVQAPFWPGKLDLGSPDQLTKITSIFGPRVADKSKDPDGWDFHAGVDIRASQPHPVYPPWPGTVEKVVNPCCDVAAGGSLSECRNTIHSIAIKHEADGATFYTRYLHLDPFGDMTLTTRPETSDRDDLCDWEAGESVTTGSVLGWTGKTGVGYDAHLHFETAVGGYTGDFTINPLRINSLPYSYVSPPRIELAGFPSGGQKVRFWVFTRSTQHKTNDESCQGVCGDQHHLNRVAIKLLDPANTADIYDWVVADFDRRTNSDGPTKLVRGRERPDDDAEDGRIEVRTGVWGFGTALRVLTLPYDRGSEYKWVGFELTLPGPWRDQAGTYKNRIEISAWDTWAEDDGSPLRCENFARCSTVTTRWSAAGQGGGAVAVAPEPRAKLAPAPGAVAGGCDNLCITYPAAGARLEAGEEHTVSVLAADGVHVEKIELSDAPSFLYDADMVSPWLFSYVPDRILIERPVEMQAVGVKNGVEVRSDKVAFQLVPSTIPPELWFETLDGRALTYGDHRVYPFDRLLSHTVRVGARDAVKGDFFEPADNIHDMTLEVKNEAGQTILVKDPDQQPCANQGDQLICSFSFDLPSAGRFTLSATALDFEQNSTTEALDVVVLDASNQPRIRLIVPAETTTKAFDVDVEAVHPAGPEWIAELRLEEGPAGGGVGQTITGYETLPGNLYRFHVLAGGYGDRTLTARFRDTFRGVDVVASAQIRVRDVVPPNARITEPASGTPVSSRIPVTFEATDNHLVQRVELYELRSGHQRKAFSALVSPPRPQASFTTRWCPQVTGTVYLQAVAYDGSGNPGSSALLPVEVPPGTRCFMNALLSIDAPAHHATVAEQVTVSVSVHDASLVSEVSFQIDGVTKATLNQPPFDWVWDTFSVADGAHRITVLGLLDGTVVDSETIDVTVDNPVPPRITSVRVGHFPDGSPVGGTVVVTVEASADAATGRTIAAVEFLVDGKLQAERVGNGGGTYRWSWDTSVFQRGHHTLRVTARDDGGLTTSLDRDVTVATIHGPTVTYGGTSSGWCQVRGALFSPGARRSPTMVYAAGGWLLYGGVTGDRTSDELWSFDGLAWNDISKPDRVPGVDWPRAAVKEAGEPDFNKVLMVYDESRAKVVLAGDWPYLWEWDVTARTWSRHDVGGFRARIRRNAWSMAYDRALRKVVLHGSESGTTDYKTLEWDGTTLEVHPGARKEDKIHRGDPDVEYLYYHNPTGLHLIANRMDENYKQEYVHWRREGKSWEEKTMELWPYLDGVALAFNPVRELTYALVGNQFKYLQYKSYFWNDSAYPPEFLRWHHAMAFDGQGQMLLAGGGGAGGLTDDSWTFVAGRTTCPEAHYTFDTVNDPATIAPIPTQSATPGTEVSFTVTATDPEGDSVTLLARSLPVNAEFPGANGNATASSTFRWRVPPLPARVDLEEVEVTFVATDPWGTSGTGSAVIRVCRDLSLCNAPPNPAAPTLLRAVPERFPDPYGYGVHLEWTPTSLPGARFYEVHYSLDRREWLVYDRDRDIVHGGYENHIGNIVFEGGQYNLPSGQTYSYRVRVLDANHIPLSPWSNILSATVATYGAAPVMQRAVAERFPDPYGHGIHLEWTPTALPEASFYEVQYATRLDYPDWAVYTNGRPIVHGGWINHHGSIACETATLCLPEGRRYFYRVRVLDAQSSAISEWSNVISGDVKDYLGFTYLVGDWNGDTRDNLAVRRGSRVLLDHDFDGSLDGEKAFGNGDAENEYLVGDWDGNKQDELAVRRQGLVVMATSASQGYGLGNDEDEYLVGDWDGDGRDNLAVRRGNCVLMDFNFDGSHDKEQCYGNGNADDEYLVGDWDGDGKDNLAIRSGKCVYMDFDFDGSHNRLQCYGIGNAEAEYLVGDWDGDGKDNLAVRRGACVHMDFDFAGVADRVQCYGSSALFRARVRLAAPQPEGPYDPYSATEVLLTLADWGGEGNVTLGWRFQAEGASHAVLSGCQTGSGENPQVRTCKLRIQHDGMTGAGGRTRFTAAAEPIPEAFIAATVDATDGQSTAWDTVVLKLAEQ
jgi:hypothetical protein